MLMHGSHVFIWIAIAALGGLPLMAITWRGSESEREEVAFRALIRRVREFFNGRSHTYADGVLIEGHIGERQGTIQLLSVNGQNQLIVTLACGRSPLLHILPVAAKRTPGLEAYTEPEHSVSLLHSIWTDDVAAVAGLLSNPDNLRTIRQFCLHRASSLRIGNGTIELHGPVPSNADYFEHIRSVVLNLSSIAGAFEREKVRLPRSHVREMLVIAAVILCVLISTGVSARSLRALFFKHKEEIKVVHFEPRPIGGWRGVTPEDFEADDIAWFSMYHETPTRLMFVDLDGSAQETGTLQLLRRDGEENGPFRLLIYDHGKQLAEDEYPNLSFVVKFKAKQVKAAKWLGPEPPNVLPDGQALLVVQSRKELDSGVVYIFQDGKIAKYHPTDYRFL